MMMFRQPPDIGLYINMHCYLLLTLTSYDYTIKLSQIKYEFSN